MDHRRISAPIVACLFLLNDPCSAQEIEDHWWQPNDTVYAVVRDTVNDRVYLGGSFTHVGPNVPFGAITGADTPDLVQGQPTPNGPVHVAIPDGEGGWYIGGSFTRIGDQVRYRLARIDANGAPYPWAPRANGVVRCFHMSGDTLFMGGSFTTINGEARTRVAAVHKTTGEVFSFAPEVPSGEVRAVLATGGSVYIGGTFTNAGGQPRNRLAELERTTGLSTSVNANANGPVNALALNGDKLIAAGGFTNIGGLTRTYIGEVERATGFATTWNAMGNDTVTAMLVQDDVLYVAGRFTNMGGISRSRIAALDISTGAALAWSSNTYGTVRAMSIEGDELYYGGDFSAIEGEPQNRLARVSLADGTLQAWSPGPNGNVQALAISNGRAYIGGGFSSICGVDRGGLAVLDGTTGLPLAWAPMANNTVRSMTLEGGALYVGGDFTTIDGIGRNRIAAIDGVTGVPMAWNPGANGRVRALTVDGPVIFVGGDFTNIGGEARNRLASLVLSSGNPTPWIPSVNNTVNTISVADGLVYIAGAFSNVNGASRSRLAALDANAQNTSWNPSADGVVNAMVLTSDRAIIGGAFTSLGGEPRSRIAAVDLVAGAAVEWNPGADEVVRTLALEGEAAYVAGGFQKLGQVGNGNAGAVHLATGSANQWAPAAKGDVYAIVVEGDKVYLGGAFTALASEPRRGFAVLGSCAPVTLYADADGDGFGDAQTAAQFCWPQAGWVSDRTDCDDQSASTHPGTPCTDGDPLTTNDALDNDCTCHGFPQLTLMADWMVTDGPVMTLVEDTARDVLYIGGDFEKLTWNTRVLARLDATTAAPLLGVAEPNGEVNTVLSDDAGGWYIGGDFTEVGGLTRNHAAHLLANGSVGAWDPDADAPVMCMLKVGGTMYLGGQFEQVGGAARSCLAAVQISNGDVLPFNAQTIEVTLGPYVSAMTLNGNTLYFGGEFEQVNGIYHWDFAAVNATTGALLTWEPNTINLPVAKKMIYDDGEVFIGCGYSTEFNFFRVVDAVSGDMLDWPTVNGPVYGLAIRGDTVLIAGGFTEVGNTPRQRLAMLDRATGELLDWDPGADQTIDAMAWDGDVLYLGGDFTALAGVERSYFGAIDISTSTVLPWDPHVTGIYYDVNVSAMATFGDQVVATGNGIYVGTAVRKNAAALDMNTGVVTDWDPGVEGEVITLAVSDSMVYLGGDFEEVGGVERTNIAAVDHGSGTLLPWDPALSGIVNKLVYSDSAVFVGGNSLTIDIHTFGGAAALHARTGHPLPWEPDVVGEVLDIIPGEEVLVAGSFQSVGGQPRNGLASVDRASGEPERWNPGPDAEVGRIIRRGDQVFAAGIFQNVAGTPRHGAMSVSGEDGAVGPWDPSPLSSTNAIEACGPVIIMGGQMMQVGGQPREGVAVTDATTGAVLPWVSATSAGVQDILVSDHHGLICLGGNMYGYGNGYQRRGLVVYGRADCAGGSGGALPGTSCDDNNPNTINEVWTDECVCEGDLVTGMDERLPGNGLKVWPNPARDRLFLPAVMDGDVLDVHGRSVARVRRSNVILVHELAPGAYLFRASGGGSVRFVKE